jgi:hypothetical protein
MAPERNLIGNPSHNLQTCGKSAGKPFCVRTFNGQTEGIVRPGQHIPLAGRVIQLITYGPPFILLWVPVAAFE